jgi:uncharacterized protein YdcH (DUF465 family)
MVDFESETLAAIRRRRNDWATAHPAARRFTPRLLTGRLSAARCFMRRPSGRAHPLTDPTDTRSLPMFENQKDQLESMLKSNEDFRRLYNRHQQLEKRVLAAEHGTAPMGDLALNDMKREKLRAKDQLTRMMDQGQAAA